MGIPTGEATIENQDGNIFEIKDKDIEWDFETQDANRHMGPEYIHIGRYEDPENNIEIVWSVYEYPTNTLNHQETTYSKGATVISYNFKLEPDDDF